MNQKEAENVLRQFRNGETKVLVASAVAEEGLDITDCEYVVVQYGMEAARKLIQSRGRARSNKGAQFYVLLSKGEQDKQTRKHWMLQKAINLKEALESSIIQSCLHNPKAAVIYKYKSANKEIQIDNLIVYRTVEVLEMQIPDIQLQVSNYLFAIYFGTVNIGDSVWVKFEVFQSAGIYECI